MLAIKRDEITLLRWQDLLQSMFLSCNEHYFLTYVSFSMKCLLQIYLFCCIFHMVLAAHITYTPIDIFVENFNLKILILYSALWEVLVKFPFHHWFKHILICEMSFGKSFNKGKWEALPSVQHNYQYYSPRWIKCTVYKICPILRHLSPQITEQTQR